MSQPQQQQQYLSKQRLLQQQQQQLQQQQQTWQYAHGNDMDMFTGVNVGRRNVHGRNNIGVDLEMVGGTPTYDSFAQNQLQRQQQQQHAIQVARRHQQLAQQQQQQYSQNYPQLESQIHPHIKSEPLDDQIEQMLTPTIEMEELIIKSEPLDDQAYNNYLRNTQQHCNTLPSMPFKSASTSMSTELTSAMNSNFQQFYPQANIKEEFSRPVEHQQKPPNFPRLKVQTERAGTLPICQRCKQVFLKKHSYIQHVTLSTCDIVEYDFKCDVCSMSFMSNEELFVHEKLHRQNKFFCHKYCGKYFDTIEMCEMHEFQHHEYSTYVCNICSDTFPSRELLFSHMPQHQQQPRFDCPICRLWFQTPLELHQHRLASPYFCGKYYNANVRSTDFRSPIISSSSQRLRFSSPDLHLRPGNVVQGASRRYYSSTSSGTLPSMSSFNNRAFQQDCFMMNPMSNRNTSMTNSISHMSRVKPEIKLESELLFPTSEYSPHSAPLAIHTPNQARFMNEFTDDSFSASSSNTSRSFNNDFSNFATTSNSSSQILRPEVVDDTEDAVCCVSSCGTRKSTSPSLQFFCFPRDEKYLHQWLHNLKMLHHSPDMNYDHLRICSLHFPKRCINRYSLCYWAVPTFNLGHDEVANLYQNREITNTFTSGENARCSMPGCNSQRGESNLKFYNFPKEVKMLIKWCQNARLPVHTKEPRHFCSRHFEDRCFGKFRLKPWAVPTIHLGTPYGRIHDNPSVLILEEKKCCLSHCKRARSSDFNLSLYRFPRDETLLRRWCYNLRLDPDVYRGKNHKICSNHFIKEVLGLRKLSPGAVPTLNLGHNDTFNYYENELTPPVPLPTPAKTYSFHNASANVSTNSSMSSVSHFASVSLSSSPTNFSSASTPNSSSANLMDFADYCLVKECNSTRTTEGVTLHTIPRRPEQMIKWCHNLKMEPNLIHKGLRICNLHFEPYCIGGCMRPFAVPTLNLGHDDPNIHKNPEVIKKLNIRETCCVQTCKRNRDRDRANLHRFPSKLEMLAKWCANLKKPLPDGTRLFNDAICEVHFEDRCLRNKRIEKWAIPTLNLGHNNIVHQLPSEDEISEMWARQNVSTANNGEEEGVCCVDSCKRNPDVDDIKLYRVPDNPDILAKWSHNLQIDISQLPTLRICNLHFEPRCIGKKLHSWAIPTMNLGKHVENLHENPSHNLMTYRKEKLSQQHTQEKSIDEFGDPLPKIPWAPRCCLPHCRNKRGVNNVQLFRIPYNNRSMMAKWCHNLQIPLTQLKPRRVCSIHFEPHVLTKRCPMPQAVPTLDLNTPNGYKIYQNPSRLKTVKMSAQTICSVTTCQKTRSDGVQLFRLPLKGPQLRKWAHNLCLWEGNKLPNLTTRAQMRVCSAHFEPHSFGAKRLVPGAIPTLNVGHERLDDLYANEAQPFCEIQCVVAGCNSIKDADNHVRLYKFPSDDEDLLWKWCNNLKMNPIDCAGVRICQRHFEEDCKGAKNLFKWAIPTIDLGHRDEDIELIQNPKPEDRYVELIAKCLVPNCGKTRKFDEAQLNSFPKNPRAFRRWKHNLKMEYLDFKRRDQYKICNDHFEPICLGKNRLKFGAIPTINLGHNDSSDLYNVKAEEMQYVMFGKMMAEKSGSKNDSIGGPEDISRDGVDIVNDGEGITAETAITLGIENKCSFPYCTATKTILRETYELPKSEELLTIWSKKMKLEIETLNAQFKLCGLHFIEVYEATQDDFTLDDENKKDFDQLALTYYRARNSLTIRSAHCSVPGCKVSQLSTEYKLYPFPYNRELIEKWTQNTLVEVDEHRRYLQKVCGRHFEPYCLTDTHKLRPWAIPTLYLNRDHIDVMHKNPDLNSVERRMLGRITYKCCVANCGRERTDDNVRLFNFPTDENLLEKWAHNLQLRREKCPLYKICDEHFEPHCLGQSRLRSWAIPTLKLGHKGDGEKIESIQVSGTEESEAESLPVANVKVKKTINVLKCCILNCQKSRLKHGVNLYSFPNNPVLFKKWCHNLQLATSGVQKHSRVCNIHFHKRCLDGKLLRSWAIPTLHLGHTETLYQNPKVSIPQQHCCLAHCTNFKLKTATTPFPANDEELLKKWCENLKLEILSPIDAKHKRLCLEKHFDQEVICKNQLLVGAVPTLNLGHDENPLHGNELIKNVDIQSKDEEKDISNLLQIKPEIVVGKKIRTPNNVSPICCLKHCRKEKTAEQHLTTFGFPKDPILLLKWCDNLKLNPEECIGRVCIEHFELRAMGNRRLKPGAVPTLNLGHTEQLRHTNDPKSQESSTSAHKQEQSFDEKPVSSKMLADDNNLKEGYYTENLDHSVFRLCCLKHCRRRKKEREKLTDTPGSIKSSARFFRFPREGKILKRWAHNLRLSLKYCKSEKRRLWICDAHFESDMIEKTKLKPKSVPTLDLGYNERENGTVLIQNRRQADTEIKRVCCMAGCTQNVELNENIHKPILFAFPKRGTILRKWAHNTQQNAYIAQQKDYHICERHFTLDSFDDYYELKLGAVPTLNLDHDNIDIFPNEFSEQPKICSINDTRKEMQQHQPKNVASCCVLNCEGLKGQYIVSHYPIPTEPEQRLKWCYNLRMEPEQCKNAYVCSLHFKTGCIRKRVLHKMAVPTENLSFSTIGSKKEPNNEVVTGTEMEQNEVEIGKEKCLDLFPNPEEVFQNQYPTSILRCCVHNCNKSRRQDGVCLYSFPKNRIYYLKWAHNIGLRPNLKFLQNLKVCQLHFESSCLYNKRLIVGAIPTLRLGKMENIDMTSKYDQEEIFQNNAKKLNSEIFRKRYKTNSIKCAIKGCNMVKSSAIAMISLPREDKVLREKFLTHINTENMSPNLKLCALHFVQAYRKICAFNENETTNEPMSDRAILRTRYERLLRSTYVKQLMCAIPGCEITYTDNIIFHQFPKEPSLFEKWQHNTQVKADSQKRYIFKICSLHFEERCFGSKRLRGWALPTLRLPLPKNGEQLFENSLPEEDALLTTAMDEELNCGNCCVLGCDNKPSETSIMSTSNTEERIEFWTLPINEPELLTKWLHNIGITETDQKWLRSKRICSRHFEANCFSAKYRLRHWALPTLNLPNIEISRYQNPIDVVNYSICCIPNCRNKRDRNKNINLYSFPQRNDAYFEKWIHNVRLDADICQKSRICTLHFEKRMISKRSLIKGALPTLALGHEEKEIFQNPGIKEECSQNERLSCAASKASNPVECCIDNCKLKQETTQFETPTFGVLSTSFGNKNSASRLFAFPKLGWLRQEWCENTRKSTIDASKLLICDQHFENEAMGRTRPRPLAVPTLLLGYNGAPIHDNPKQFKHYHSEEKESGEVKYVRANCCAIISCLESSKRLYKYPTKGELLNKWAENCRHNTYQASRYTFRICGKHFDTDCFEQNGRLRFGAVPTLHLGNEDLLSEIAGKLHGSEFKNDKQKNRALLPETLCGVPNCGRSKQEDGVRLFKFPNDKNSLAQWCHNLHLEPKQCRRLLICNMHFEARCITQRGVLKSAIPTLLLGHSDLSGEDLIDNPDELQKPALYVHCCVSGCTASQLGRNAIFSSIPKNQTLFEKWAHNLNIKPACHLKNHPYKKVCNSHFESFCYEHGRLKFGSIPTLNLGHDDLTDIHMVSPSDLHTRVKGVSKNHNQKLKSQMHDKQDCSYRDCQELKKRRFAHGFEIPKTPTILYKAWVKSLSGETSIKNENTTEETNIRLCPIHFKVVYEENKSLVEELKSSSNLDTVEQGNLSTITEINLAVTQMRSISVLMCGVPGCNSHVLNTVVGGIAQIRLFNLPVNREIAAKWCANATIILSDDLFTSWKICELHFEPECFLKTSKRLRSWAMPTLNLPVSDKRNIIPNESVALIINYKCCIKSCPHSMKNDDLTIENDVDNTKRLFPFPSDMLLLKKWLHNTNLPRRDVHKSRVCQRHFEEHCINKRLCQWAIPTLHLDIDKDDIYHNPAVNNKHMQKRKRKEKIKDEISEDMIPIENSVKTTDTFMNSNDVPYEEIDRVSSFKFGRREMYDHNLHLNMEHKTAENENDCTLFSDPCTVFIKEEPIDINDNDNEEIISDDQNEIFETNENFEMPMVSLPVLSPNMKSCFKIIKAESMQINNYKEDIFGSEQEPPLGLQENVCCIADCINCIESTVLKSTKLYRFPEKPLLFFKWIHNCQLNPNSECRNNFRICERHFESECYSVKECELLLGSVPTLELGKNQQHIIFRNQHCINKSDNNTNQANCCLVHCQQQIKSDIVQLFKFPESSEILDKWLQNLNIEYDSKQPWKFLICSEHFEFSCFNSTQNQSNEIELHKWAIPTLNLGDNAENSLVNPIYEESSTLMPVSTSTAFKMDLGMLSINKFNKHRLSYKRCCITHCKSLRTETVKLFRFPTNYEVAAQWQRILGMSLTESELRTRLVCSQHFETQFVGAKRLLGRNVVPTLKLFASTESVLNSVLKTQTQVEHEDEKVKL